MPGETTCRSANRQSLLSPSKCRKPYLSNPVIVWVLQCKNDKHKDGTCDELGKELTGLGEVSLRVSTEYSRRRLRGWGYRPDAMAFDEINRADIVCVDDARSNKGSENLCYEVDGEAPPWKLPKQARAKGYGGVQVCSGIYRLGYWVSKANRQECQCP